MINYKKIENSNAKQWIMMVHGFTQHMEVFNKQAEHFKDRYNVLLVDLRGHGGSAGLPGPFGIEEYADDIEKIITKEQLTDLVYWGSHTGAAAGLALYFRNPGCFKALILEGPVIPGIKMERTTELLERFRTLAREEGVRRAVDDWLANDWFKIINANPETHRKEQMAAIVGSYKGEALLCDQQPREVTDVNGRLGEITADTLVINGSGDLFEFILAASAFREAPKAQGVLVDKAGAFPGWEQPEQVNKVVDVFLKNVFHRCACCQNK